MKDIDPKQFPLRVGDKVIVIRTDYGAYTNDDEVITITMAVNLEEGYYEGVTESGEKIKGLSRFQLKKK